MQLRHNSTYNLKDVSIPQIFFTDYLPNLEGNAARLYLWLCHVLSAKGFEAELDEEEVKIKLGFDGRTYSECKRKLVEHHLIKMTQYEIGLVDLRVKQATELANKLEKREEITVVEDAVIEKRAQLFGEINRDYYAGKASSTVVHAFHSIVGDYHFDLEVIPLLFNVCREYGKLDRPSYLLAVAKNWHDELGVRSYDDAITILDRDLRVSKLTKSMNWNATEPVKAMVRKWIGYFDDDEIIQYALTKTVSSTNPTPRYVDKIISDWFDAGLKTLDEVAEYDQKHTKRRRYSQNKVLQDGIALDNSVSFESFGFEPVESEES